MEDGSAFDRSGDHPPVMSMAIEVIARRGSTITYDGLFAPAGYMGGKKLATPSTRPSIQKQFVDCRATFRPEFTAGQTPR
jgi:hypothetical protein